MRVLFLTKYSQKGASSRYRTYQYLAYLQQHGVEPFVSPFLPDKYLERLYEGRSIPAWLLLRAFCGRMAALLGAWRYDLVVVEYELIPFFPPVLEYVLHWLNPASIVDYDDAVSAKYETLPFLRSKIPAVLRLSRAVSVGNPYLKEHAERFNPNVALIPTAVDLGKYRARESYTLGEKRAIIGWIGTPVTSTYLLGIAGALRRVSEENPFVLRCIGTSPDFALAGIEVENVRWDEATEVEHLLTFDIGVMPLSDDSFSRGKCGLKLIQYMACGVPAVASPVGMNNDIVQHGWNGFLASTDSEWVDHLAALIANGDLRERLGRNARQTVATNYSLQGVAPRLLGLFERTARQTTRRGT